MRSAIFPVMAALLAACSWTRPNTTEAEFRRDTYECQREANNAYPVAMSAAPAAAGQVRCTTLYNQTNCTTSAAPTGPTYDMNAGARVSAQQACLRARGYSH